MPIVRVSELQEHVLGKNGINNDNNNNTNKHVNLDKKKVVIQGAVLKFLLILQEAMVIVREIWWLK